MEAGLVDEDDFDDVRRGRTATDLLTELLASTDEMARREAGDLVVCHGDVCLPNVLVDPATYLVTGIIDVGRLGVADTHQDLAPVTRSLEAPINPAFGPDRAAAFLGNHQRADRVDPERIGFYRLLDEFFQAA